MNFICKYIFCMGLFLENKLKFLKDCLMSTPPLDASFDSQKTDCNLKFSRIWSKFEKNKLTYY